MIDLIEKFLDYKIKSKNLKKETLDLYEIDLKDFKDFVDKDLLEIKNKDVIQYVAELKKSYQNSSISRKLSTIKGFYKYFLEENIIGDNPADGIQIEFLQGKIQETMELWELENVLNVCGLEPKNQRDKMVIRLMVETNFSINEILTIRKSELEMASYEYVFTEDKNDKIKISKELSSELKKYVEICAQSKINRNSDFIFLGLSRQGFRVRFMKLGEKAGIKRLITPNMLRNTIKNRMRESEKIDDKQMLLNIKTKYFEIGIGDD